MNQEIKTKWVAALRSGDYKQGTDYLKKDDCYCCLGVLCEISKLETGFGIDENKIENKMKNNTGNEIDGNKTIANTIQDWAGLKCKSGGFVLIGGEIISLAQHNDKGRTFLEIADAIEAQL